MFWKKYLLSPESYFSARELSALSKDQYSTPSMICLVKGKAAFSYTVPSTVFLLLDPPKKPLSKKGRMLPLPVRTVFPLPSVLLTRPCAALL